MQLLPIVITVPQTYGDQEEFNLFCDSQLAAINCSYHLLIIHDGTNPIVENYLAKRNYQFTWAPRCIEINQPYLLIAFTIPNNPNQDIINLAQQKQATIKTKKVIARR